MLLFFPLALFAFFSIALARMLWETNIFTRDLNNLTPDLAELDGLVHGHLPLQQLLHHVRLAQLLQDQEASPENKCFYCRVSNKSVVK